MPTTLKNRTRQTRTYILSAGPHVAELLPVRRQAVVIERHDRESGARSLETIQRRLPESISLMPKGTPGMPDPSIAAGLPNSVLHCQDIQRDIRAGFLDVATTPDAEPAVIQATSETIPEPGPQVGPGTDISGRKNRKET